MESKPTQNTNISSNPKPLTIEECKRHLELTKKAIFLGLLEFEIKWNPYGYNDSHIYEDLRDAITDSNQLRVNQAKRLFLKLKIFKCEAQEGIETEVLPEEMKISYIYTVDHWVYAKSGPI